MLDPGLEEQLSLGDPRSGQRGDLRPVVRTRLLPPPRRFDRDGGDGRSPRLSRSSPGGCVA